MLVLLNQEVIDVGDPLETLRRLGVVDLRAVTVAKAVALGRGAAFAGGGIERAHLGIRQMVAAMFAVSGDVNCADFAYAESMASARDVGVRLGLAPILTLAHLWSAQQSGRLSTRLIDDHVWRVAGGGAAA